MIKKLLLIPLAVLSLTACDTVAEFYEEKVEPVIEKITVPDCEKAVGIASTTAGLVSDELVIASQNDLINDEDKITALEAINAAQSIADNTAPLCPLNESAARKALKAVYEAVAEVEKLMNKED